MRVWLGAAHNVTKAAGVMLWKRLPEEEGSSGTAEGTRVITSMRLFPAGTCSNMQFDLQVDTVALCVHASQLALTAGRHFSVTAMLRAVRPLESSTRTDGTSPLLSSCWSCCTSPLPAYVNNLHMHHGHVRRRPGAVCLAEAPNKGLLQQQGAASLSCKADATPTAKIATGLVQTFAPPLSHLPSGPPSILRMSSLSASSYGLRPEPSSTSVIAPRSTSISQISLARLRALAAKCSGV